MTRTLLSTALAAACLLLVATRLVAIPSEAARVGLALLSGAGVFAAGFHWGRLLARRPWSPRTGHRPTPWRVERSPGSDWPSGSEEAALRLLDARGAEVMPWLKLVDPLDEELLRGVVRTVNANANTAAGAP
jgi:hypothetical protein